MHLISSAINAGFVKFARKVCVLHFLDIPEGSLTLALNLLSFSHNQLQNVLALVPQITVGQ